MDKKGTICKVCLSNNTKELIDFGQQPNTFHLLERPENDSYTHELVLNGCQDCGFVFNSNPMPACALYENYRWTTSVYPARHLGWLCDKVTDDYLVNKEMFIVDVGCNDGYLLNLFKQKGYENLLGIEPAKDCASKAMAKDIRIINDYFSLHNAKNIKDQFGIPDVIFCRHVIEHIEELDDFVHSFTELMGKQTTMVLEMPCFEAIAGKGDFSSIWEQHVNFFSLITISKFLHRCNLKVESHSYLPFGGGSLLIFIKFDKVIETNFKSQVDLANKFKKRTIDNINITFNHIKQLKAEGKKIVAYGAGARSSCFLNLSKVCKFIDYVVDDNPDKVGMFMPMSNLPVLSTKRIIEDQPDYCIISPFNCKENEKIVMEKLSDYVKNGGSLIELYPGDFMDSPILDLEGLV